MSEPTPQQILFRLPHRKAWFFAECVRRVEQPTPKGIGAYVDVFAVADAVGVHRKQAESMLDRFEQLGLMEGRNNYDGWVLPLGFEVAALVPTPKEQ